MALRERMEREPVWFMVRALEPMLDAARAEIAAFVGASSERLAFVPNATAGVNAVLRSLDFSPEDELLVTNQEYNASRNALDFVAKRSGARVVEVVVPFPVASPDEVVGAIVGAMTDRTRLLLVDHVTSQTAIVNPIERIVAEAGRRGIDVLVDGAHAPGMLDLDVERLGASWYTGNCHKWICAPKGAGFLWARDDRRSRIRPTSISHGANSPRTDRSAFHLEFDWTGTFDPTAWLCVPAAIRTMESMVEGGWAEIRRRNRALAIEARDVLCEALEIEPPVPDSMLGSMAAVPIPDGKASSAPSLYGDPIQDALLERFGIEVPVVPWPAPPNRVLRVSAQLYNAIGEYRHLAERLLALLDEERHGAAG